MNKIDTNEISAISEIFSRYFCDHIYDFMNMVTFKHKDPTVEDYIKEISYLIDYTKLLHKSEHVAITLERLENILKDLQKYDRTI